MKAFATNKIILSLLFAAVAVVVFGWLVNKLLHVVVDV